MKRLSLPSSPPRAKRRQGGVYAIEFALVFLVFFALVYGIICYGILFTFRLGLQNAAEDGARAALRYEENLDGRCRNAKDIALAQSSAWLPVTPRIDAEIRGVESTPCPGASAREQCKVSLTDCQIVVTVTANGMNRILPVLSFAMPDVLRGQASVLLDLRDL